MTKPEAARYAQVPVEAAPGRGLAVVHALLGQFRFASVAAVVGVLDLPESSRGYAERLASAGEFLLDLDAEDFDLLAEAGDLPPEVVDTVHAAHFPREANGAERGSLSSLVPLVELMLEALQARWARREPVHVVVLCHLLAEYLPLLAWERTLGHAGDPLRLPEFVGVEGSKWGVDVPGCGHSGAQRSAAERIQHVAYADLDGWTAYLDRFHSRVGAALARCASGRVRGRPAMEGICRTPCALWTQLPDADQTSLGARIHLARMYAASPVVALRHHAPVGHFFGVPSPGEIEEAWERSWTKLSRPWKSGDNPLDPATRVDGPPVQEALPGMAALVSAIAGRPIGAGRVLRTIRGAIEDTLGVTDHGQTKETTDPR